MQRTDYRRTPVRKRKNGGVRPLRGRNDEVAAQSRSERDRWTFYETVLV